MTQRPLSLDDDDPVSLPPRNLISAGGTMADLTRAYDWGATTLGPIGGWSEALLCSVNLMLACRFPAVIFWGPEMIQFYNDAYLPLMAEKHPAALGQAAPECWKEAWHIIGPQFESVLVRGETVLQESVLVPVRRDGQLQDIYWTYSYSPIFEVSGDVTGILVVCHDVTGVVLATRERDALAEQLGQVLEVTSDAVLSIDASWRITYMNKHAREASGPIGDVVGKDFWESFPATIYEGSPYVEHYYRAMNERIPGEFEAFYPEPLNITVRVQVRPARDGIVLFFRNVTEQRQTTAALMQSEKLAVVGRLAASIAHEINNPLESVTNLLYLARHSQDFTEVQHYLETAERELRRVSVISNQTLRFYRQSTKPRLVTCQDLCQSALSIYQGRLLNSNVEVQTRKRALEPVMCFDGEIRQVLSNLIGNAIDAMHHAGGRLFIRSNQATDWATGRQGLVLTVADTGSGINPEVMKRIFDPFFTTKGFGGTGLGLWVSQEIVARHHGALRVRSSQGKGTVFNLFLPFDAAPRQPASP